LKRKTNRTPEQFGEQLIENVLATFTVAYDDNRKGVSLDAILIEHDILAAGVGQAKVITAMQHKAIKSAVAAVEQRLPLAYARHYLEHQLRTRLHELIHETETEN